MEAGGEALEGRLRQITDDFFRVKCGLQPKEVEATWREDLVRLRVRGFLSPAEEAVARRQDGRRVLHAYYERFFENLSPLLEVVVQEACARRLGERRILLDVGQAECVCLLRLAAPDRATAQGPAAEGGVEPADPPGSRAARETAARRAREEGR